MFACAYAILLTLCRGEQELIWYDTMDNFTAHWTNTGAVQHADDATNCASSSCVWIRGYVTASDWITRSTALGIIANLDAYSSFTVQFDVTLSNMEDPNHCIISYKYDTDNVYTTTRSFTGDAAIAVQQFVNESGTISMDDDTRNNAQSLFIRLETDGDSTGGNDYCYFDNVYLFGDLVDKNIIFYDDMSDFVSTGWIASNSQSVVQSTSTTSCVGGGCVELHGWDQTDNSVHINIPHIDRYYDIFIEYDVYLTNMEADNGCQIKYKYDTDPNDDYYLIQNIPGGNGDVWMTNNIVTIHDDPAYKNSTVLSLKLATFGNSLSGGDICYFDNIYVKGTLLNETNGVHLEKQIANMRQKDQNTEHIFIIGDMGGQDTAPYYTEEQVVTAEMMNTISKYHDVHGIIALGDNIYNSGVTDEFDPRFQTTFENVYTQHNLLDIGWYFTTGNHDYRSNITGEVEYSKHSTRWNFPSLYYTKSWYFGANNEIELLWVALDTYILCGSVTDGTTQEDCNPPDAQRAIQHWQWLNDTLAASNATFTLVGGHTPIYSYAYHGPTVQLIDELNPLLEHHKVNAYIFGHDHLLQFIEDNTTDARFLQHIGSGAGHGCREGVPHINSELNPSVEALKYMDCIQGGFVRMEINVKKLSMQAFYYLPTSHNAQFFSGVWNRYGEYRNIHEILYGETRAPTAEPTANPTALPTNHPTTDPSESPTRVPTDSPSMTPSVAPTRYPTVEPTTAKPTRTTSLVDNVESEEGDSVDRKHVWNVVVFIVFTFQIM